MTVGLDLDVVEVLRQQLDGVLAVRVGSGAVSGLAAVGHRGTGDGVAGEGVDHGPAVEDRVGKRRQVEGGDGSGLAELDEMDSE